MKLSREKLNILLARKNLTISKLAELYGASRNRMHVILNSQKVTPACAGKLADALEVDVTEIIE